MNINVYFNYIVQLSSGTSDNVCWELSINNLTIESTLIENRFIDVIRNEENIINSLADKNHEQRIDLRFHSNLIKPMNFIWNMRINDENISISKIIINEKEFNIQNAINFDCHSDNMLQMFFNYDFGRTLSCGLPRSGNFLVDILLTWQEI